MAQVNQDTLVSNYITKDVVEKLSEDELISLVKDLEEMKYNPEYLQGVTGQGKYIYEQFASEDFVKSILICVIISILVFIILVISLPLYFNMRKNRSFNAMIKEFATKGQQTPNELILSLSKKRSDFQKAIIMVSTGIAVSVALAIMIKDSRIWAVGLIPVIIGIGYYIAYRITN